MRLTMLGTGHAMVTDCYNTCFVLSDDTGISSARHLLVDGGGGNGLLRQLKLVGIDPCDIHDIFATHRHLDHVMGVMWLLRVWTQRMLQGRMSGEARIYAHDEVCGILRTMAQMLLNEAEQALIGSRIFLVELQDKEPLEVIGHTLVPFDIQSTKAKQFGFRLRLDGERWLTCCGDEPLPQELYGLACGSEWLLHEAFCLRDEIEPQMLARMHHSSVADACAAARELGVGNLVLYHSTDAYLPCRQERFLAEGREHFAGPIYVPRDLDVIDLITKEQSPVC